MKGWGPKSSVCPSKPRESNFFGGISRDFAGISWKRPKSLRKKSLGSIFGPYFETGHARVETRVLKTVACRKNVGGFFKHW